MIFTRGLVCVRLALFITVEWCAERVDSNDESDAGESECMLHTGQAFRLNTPFLLSFKVISPPTGMHETIWTVSQHQISFPNLNGRNLPRLSTGTVENASPAAGRECPSSQ